MKIKEDINLDEKIILITGAAGFIGANLVKELLKTVDGATIVGLDNLNDYYDVSIKEYRLKEIEKLAENSSSKWRFIKGNIADKRLIDELFAEYKFDIVVNLAAQAGVRYSITNPDVYIESNIIGFYNILEACRHSYDNGAKGVEHLVYASSSSVYGSNKKVPYSTDDKVDNPVSLYAATKKSNELLAHAYSKLYNIPSTGLRFFTVYGPAGRPDMAYFGFTNKLIKGETIQIFNYGNCKRDFTYVDDIVEGVKRVMMRAPEKKNGEDGLPIPPYQIYNIGNNHPENLLDFVQILQEELVRAGVLPKDYDFEAHKKLVPMQAGDVPVTYADTSALERDFGFKPNTSLRDGLRKFAEWYKGFYRLIAFEKSFEIMIKTRDDLKKFLNYEKKKYGITDCLRYWIMLFCGSERAAIWRYQRSLRVTEYHYNMNHKVRCAISRIKLNHLSNKYGLHIGLNTCGRGLKIMHLGSVLINGNAQLGDDCSIHINTAIVAQGVNDSTPIIGRGVVIGVGAIIVGGVHIANNVAIGAGAVVVKDVQEENIAVAGVPARKVSDNGRLNWSNKKNETNTDS